MLNLITNQIIPKPFLTIECVFCELNWINFASVFLYVKHFSFLHNAEMMCVRHP